MNLIISVIIMVHAIEAHLSRRHEYQGDVIETTNSESSDVMTLMQNVLCRNFPTIPCEIIKQDNKLNKLIALSIKQINSRMARPRTTARKHNEPRLPLFPTVDSEDLSNFLDVKETGYFPNDFGHEHSPERKKKVIRKTTKNKPSHGAKSKNSIRNRKLTKYYPHKTGQTADRHAPLEKTNRRNRLKSYHNIDPSVWRIDYVNNGNKMLALDELSGKIMKNDENAPKIKRPNVFMRDDPRINEFSAEVN